MPRHPHPAQPTFRLVAVGAEAQELLASGFVFKRTDRLSILGPASKLGGLRVIRGCSVAGVGAGSPSRNIAGEGGSGMPSAALLSPGVCTLCFNLGFPHSPK